MSNDTAPQLSRFAKIVATTIIAIWLATAVAFLAMSIFQQSWLLGGLALLAFWRAFVWIRTASAKRRVSLRELWIPWRLS
jgi:hypothetical protein